MFTTGFIIVVTKRVLENGENLRNLDVAAQQIRGFA